MKNASFASSRTVWLVKRQEPVPKAETPSAATHVIILTTSGDQEKIFETLCKAVSGYRLTAAGDGLITDAVREVLDRNAAPTEMPNPAYGLSAREKETLELVTHGLVKKEIAARMGLSYHTVDNHLRHIYSKLRVNTRGAAVAKAINERLL